MRISHAQKRIAKGACLFLLFFLLMNTNGQGPAVPAGSFSVRAAASPATGLSMPEKNVAMKDDAAEEASVPPSSKAPASSLPAESPPPPEKAPPESSGAASLPPAKPIAEGGAFSQEDTALLNELIASCGSGVSVYYKDLTTGMCYEYKPLIDYYCASLVKAPFAMYMYCMADEGKLDLTRQVPYKWDYYQGGNGSVIDKSPVGTQFTLNELLEYMVRSSDNAAFMMVKTVVPTDGFKAFMRTLGLKKPGCFDALTTKDIRGNINAHDAGVIMEAIYDYDASGSANAKKLVQDLMNTTHPLMTCPYPMARKMASWEGSTHDAAIVYAPRPYILTICTGRGHKQESDYTPKEYAVFTDISEKIAELSQKASELSEEAASAPPIPVP